MDHQNLDFRSNKEVVTISGILFQKPLTTTLKIYTCVECGSLVSQDWLSEHATWHREGMTDA